MKTTFLTSFTPIFLLFLLHTTFVTPTRHLRNRPQVSLETRCSYNDDCPYLNSTCNWLSQLCQCPFGYILVTTSADVNVSINDLNSSQIICEVAHCRGEECRKKFKLGDGAKCNDDSGLCECHNGHIDVARNICIYDGYRMPVLKIVIISIFGLLICGSIASGCLLYWKRKVMAAKRRCAQTQAKLEHEEKKDTYNVY